MKESIETEEILFVSEIIKILASLYLMSIDTDSSSDYQSKGIAKIAELIRKSGKMFLLAGIYAVMNILGFVALKYIGAGEFAVCAQLKILTVFNYRSFASFL